MAVRDIHAQGLQGQVKDVVEQGREQIKEEVGLLGKDLPWFVATLGSIAASLGLFVTGNKRAANFVGLWAPTLLCFGMLRRIDRNLHA